MSDIPEITDKGGLEDEKNELSHQEGDVVSETRGNIFDVEDKDHYTFGKEFNFDEEVKNKNISSESAEFLNSCNIAKEVLADLYEYDAYTYIHTVQMLNTGCLLFNEENITGVIRVLRCEEKTDIKEKYQLSDTDLKYVFLGAIVMHDWGKRRIDRGLLNKPGFLDASETLQMNKHVIETANVLIERIRKMLNVDNGDIETKEFIEGIMNDNNQLKIIKFIQMLFIVISHHRNTDKSGDTGYPSDDEIEVILPDYKEWLNSIGEGQKKVLALIDVNDAIRSKRSYKNVPTREVAKSRFDAFFEGKLFDGKYVEVKELIFDIWEKMNGADKYNEKRENDTK